MAVYYLFLSACAHAHVLCEDEGVDPSLGLLLVVHFKLLRHLPRLFGDEGTGRTDMSYFR